MGNHFYFPLGLSLSLQSQYILAPFSVMTKHTTGPILFPHCSIQHFSISPRFRQYVIPRDLIFSFVILPFMGGTTSSSNIILKIFAFYVAGMGIQSSCLSHLRR